MHVPTDEVARAISQKLESSPGILYSEIARKAVQCGRRDLAVKVRTWGVLTFATLRSIS